MLERYYYLYCLFRFLMMYWCWFHLFHCDQIALEDPYVDRDGDGWAPGPHYEARGRARLLFILKDSDDADPLKGPDIPVDVWNRVSKILLGELLDLPALSREARRLGQARIFHAP